MVKKTLVWSAAAIGAATLGLPAAPVSAQDIVIGLSFGKTGRYASIAKTTETAVDIAEKEINAAGGIHGKKLRVVKFDTAGDPKQAVVAVRKFARDDGALAVVGPFASAEARIAFPAGEREGIVQIPNASSAPKLAPRFS
ncbi:MAG: ABC transporter substrate-binding protein, partial [Rhodospirillaceae bacterium]|nr:ABC transporter substrate-binding protein [Rhodospirillaceae bacterium]